MGSFGRSAFCLLVVVATVCFQIACGGGGTSSTPLPPSPTFNSTPVFSATEGTSYTYQLAATDPAGGAVTFTMTSAPEGATLSGNTVTWMPTATQSRTANNFSVKATTTGGGWAVQSWSVTPRGTVRVTWINTYWDFDTSRTQTFLPLITDAHAVALIPRSDGTFETLTGPAAENGVFTIPNVPGGYYWLRLPLSAMYWTSSSEFDAGSDFVGSVFTGSNMNPRTTFNLDFTGLEPTAGVGAVAVDIPTVMPYVGSTSVESDVFTGTATSSATISPTPYAALVRQYKPVSLNSIDAFVLGPTLKLTDLNLAMGGTHTLSGQLTPSADASLSLNIKGSSWAPLLDHVAPATATPGGTTFDFSAQPTAGQNAAIPRGMMLVGLKATPDFSPIPGGVAISVDPVCQGGSMYSGFTNTLPGMPLILTDQDFGTVHYGDPFPSTWPRVFSVCQRASVEVPFADSSETVNLVLTNAAEVASPTAPVAALISPVRDPKINGTNLLAATATAKNPVTITWTAPSLGSPYGYEVGILTPGTTPGGFPIYNHVATLATSKTSLSVPPELLAVGKTYIFMITAKSDGHANIETAPNRSVLPTAHADLVSGLVTIAAQ